MDQDPEQIARDNIDGQLYECGWVFKDKTRINLNAVKRRFIISYELLKTE
jgi:hypothetical protein